MDVTIEAPGMAPVETSTEQMAYLLDPQKVLDEARPAIERAIDEDASMYEYQVKVSFTREDTTEIFATKEQATEFARQQLRQPNVEKCAIKKVLPKEDKPKEKRSDADDGL